MKVDLREQLAKHQGVRSGPPVLENRFSKLGMVEVFGSGIWKVDYVDAHFEALAVILENIRDQFGCARVLVNLSEAPVQPPDTAERISYWTNKIYRDVDRVAILVSSIPVEAEMKRRVMIATFEVFISEVAARLWLYKD